MDSMAVCIINYNTCDQLRDCLQSVLAEQPSELIVVDNGSKDGSAEMVARIFPAVKLIRIHRNLGYGAAANLAVRASQANTFLLLNSDTLLQAGALQALHVYLDANPWAGLVGPQIVNPDGSPQRSCFHFPKPLHMFLYLSQLYRLIARIPLLRENSLQTCNTALPVPWVLGAAIAFRREVFDAAGGFDETFFLYFEEVDLSYRLAKMGWETHFAPVTQVIHIGGASTSQEPAETNVRYFASLAQFYRKHYPVVLLLELVLLVKIYAMIRLARNMIVLQFARDKTNLAILRTKIQGSQTLLQQQWHRDQLIV